MSGRSSAEGWRRGENRQSFGECEWTDGLAYEEKRRWPVKNGNTYTVHELAKLSGCTVRALHHYDEQGLVRAQRDANGYRRYGSAEVDRLQQVLLYREADMSLTAIKRLLDDPEFDAREALLGHLRELHSRRERLDGLVASVESTLAGMEGGVPMSDTQKFEAFKKDMVDRNERTYGAEVRERWGDEAADASNAKVAGMTEEAWRHAQELQRRIAEALRAGMEAGDPTGAAGQLAADLHRQWLCAFWKDGAYSKQAHVGLAEMYVADDRFKAYYEAIAPGAAEFLRDAIKTYCA